eukprot:PhF_6_TR29213/c0_g1_i1/m.42739/K15414/C1QBP; complement component 1 Q subcomponent-binding protein, mitochondrial
MRSVSRLLVPQHNRSSVAVPSALIKNVSFLPQQQSSSHHRNIRCSMLYTTTQRHYCTNNNNNNNNTSSTTSTTESSDSSAQQQQQQQQPFVRKKPLHPRTFMFTENEIQEELMYDSSVISDDDVPKHWTYSHTPGTCFYLLKRTFNDEKIEIRSALDKKDPEATFRQEDGERVEGEHFLFTVLIRREGRGTLEFHLASIDNELVLDSLIVHQEDIVIESFMDLETLKVRQRRYQGPPLAELDEELMDELYAYLEQRGIDDVFAEFIADRGAKMEQEEYVRWLRELHEFSKK